MENTYAKTPHRVTKDDLLTAVGVSTKKARSKVSSLVDVASSPAGRKLATVGHFELSTVVGVSGSVVLSSASGDVARLSAPFVIGAWAMDDRGVSMFTVMADAHCDLLLIDRRAESSVLDATPRLRAWANASADRVQRALSEQHGVKASLSLVPSHL